MKIKEFEKKLKEMDFKKGLVIEVCYALNDKGNVILDEESMTEVFETGIRMLNDVLEG